jgi:phage terminase small subunit
MAEKKKKHKKLNTKQRLWVENYLSNGFNASLAAKEAGYKAKSDGVFRNIGYENVTKPHIQAIIQERLEEAAMGANDVLARITTMAKSFDIADYIKQIPTYSVDKDGKKWFSGHALKLDLDKLQADGYSHLIKKIRQTKEGLMVEWQDPLASLGLLAKHHKLLVDKFEFEGTIATSTAEAVDALQKAKKELGNK